MADNTNESKSILERLVPILLIASIALAFFVGVLWQKVSNIESGSASGTKTQGDTATGTQQVATSNVSLEQIKKLFEKDLIKFGDENRKVLFVEVMDPSCPYCHVASGKNPELNVEVDESYKQQWENNNSGKNANEYKDEWQRFTLASSGGQYLSPVDEMKKLVESGDASLIYLYQNGHNAGEMAQKALYCAYDMGKFWEVHDLLMSNKGYDMINTTVKNDKGKTQELVDFLKSAIDSGKLKDCLDSGKYDKRLSGDMQIAQSLGIGGTPGFFINEVSFAGAYSWNDMKPVVEQFLQ